jgi:hypothetical protein
MGDEWIVLCQADDLTVGEPHIQVRLGESRCKKVSVTDGPEVYSLSAVVVGKATVSALPNLAIQAWRRNRSTPLVGFRVDERGRLVGEAWAPNVGLTPIEFQTYVRTVAVECDRFEYTLTGRDIG